MSSAMNCWRHSAKEYALGPLKMLERSEGIVVLWLISEVEAVFRAHCFLWLSTILFLPIACADVVSAAGLQALSIDPSSRPGTSR